MKRIFLVCLISIALVACNKPLKEYTLNDGMQLQLFSDSTFIQEVRLLERKYAVSGTWTGSTAEGNSFTTKTKASGMQEIVVTNYSIVNGHAIPKEN